MQLITKILSTHHDKSCACNTKPANECNAIQKVTKLFRLMRRSLIEMRSDLSTCDVVTPLDEEPVGYQLVLSWAKILRLCLHGLRSNFYYTEAVEAHMLDTKQL